MHRRLLAIAVLAVLFMTAGNASAQDVTFRFTGQVRELSGSPFEDISPGTTFNGCYTFNLERLIRTAPARWRLPPRPRLRCGRADGITTFQTNRTAGGFLIELVNNHGNPSSDNYYLGSENNRISKRVLNFLDELRRRVPTGQ